MVAGVMVINAGGIPYLQLYVIDKNNKAKPVRIERENLRTYVLGTDAKIRFEVFNDNGIPKVRFFQDDKFCCEGTLRDDALVTIGIAKGGGVYAGANVRKLDSWAWDLKLFR